MSHKNGYIWEPYSLLHIYKWIYMSITSPLEVKISCQTVLLTSTNKFQTVKGFQHTSYTSLNSWKSKTHDKGGGKKDPWMEFLLARKWIWCHADTKTRHAAPEILCCCRGNEPHHNNVGCWTGVFSVGAHVISRFVCVSMFMYRSVWLRVRANSAEEVIWDLPNIISVEDAFYSKQAEVKERIYVCFGFSFALFTSG